MKRWQRTLLGMVVGWWGVWVPAAAQDPPIVIFPSPPSAGRTVAVALGQIRDQVATEINVEPDQIPEAVRLPAPEAARVCGITDATLQATTGPAQCLAQTTSLALDLTVRREAQLAGRGLPAPSAPALPQQ